MFKKRKHKIAVLDRVIERNIKTFIDIGANDSADDEVRTRALNMMEEERDALISALVAYETEPITVAAAVVITSIFWIGIVWPIVSVI